MRFSNVIVKMQFHNKGFSKKSTIYFEIESTKKKKNKND